MSAADEPFFNALDRAIHPWGLHLSDDQRSRLAGHFHAVCAANQRMNLTRITEPEAAAVKHYADSLAVLAWCRQEKTEIKTVLDVGTGAGFPAVPLAIAQPDWRITALDTTGKKARFVAESAAALGLSNLRVEHAHADHWRPAPCFDLVLARAVGRLTDCLDFAARLTRPAPSAGGLGGWFVSYKTASMENAELDEALAADRSLKPMPHFDYDLPLADDLLHRRLVIFRRAKS